MRTTIDLPDDLHRQARAIAADTGKSLSETVGDLLRRALSGGGPGDLPTTSGVTGLPVVVIGGVVTTEDVRVLEDEA